jgi:hypothetical protein
MADVCITEDLPAPAEIAWTYLEDFGDMSAWSPDSKVIKFEGQGAGSVRTVESLDGLYVERCESFSPEDYSFQYSLQESPHPYESYLATVTLIPVDENRCQIEWQTDFEITGIKKEHVVKALIDTYRGYFIKHLRTSLENR